MRKITLVFVLILSIVLVACNKTTEPTSTKQTTNSSATTTTTNSVDPNIALVEAALADLTLSGLDNVTSRIVLPGKGLHNVTITWVSSNNNYITNAGVVTQPDHTVGDQTVTITATLTLGNVTRTKEFTATVKALENPANAEPTLVEEFDYTVGENLDDQTTWSVTKGGRTATIVDLVPGNNMPSSKVIKMIENVTSDTHYERAIDVSNVTVLEFMFLQENEGAGVNLEFLNGSSRVFSVSTNRNNSFNYRESNGSEVTVSGKKINPGVWYKARIEIDVTNSKYKFFYYDFESATSLVELTPDGGVSFPAGQSAVNMLRIRVKNAPITGAATYYANFVVNTSEALVPNAGTNPNRTVGIGEVTNISETINLTTIDTFTEENPVVKNRFNGTTLVEDTDYEVTVDLGGLDVTVAGTYTVTYTITNKNYSDDVKTISTIVTVVSYVAPNNIDTFSHTVINTDGNATFTFNLSKIEGTIYLVVLPIGSTAPTAEEIKNSTSAVTKEVLAVTETMTQAISAESDVYAVIHSDNGYSNIVVFQSVDTVYHIKTMEQFNQMANSGSTDSYVLDNDLDATGYTWEPTTTKFKGTFDGKGYTVSNLTIVETTGYGGIFNEIEKATIKNLVISNMNITQPGRGGLIAGQAIESNIENIKVYNSKVTSTGDSYAALLVGRVKTNISNFSNIHIENSEVHSTGTYVGGIIGYVESSTAVVNISDVYINNLKVTEEHATGQMAGGVVARVGSGASLNVNRVFINVNLTAMKNVGGILGKNDSGAVDKVNITDAVIMGSLSSGNSNSATISGNVNVTATNVWDAGVTGTGTAGHNLTEEFKVTTTDISEATWWQTNVPNIVNSNLWEMVNGMPILK